VSENCSRQALGVLNRIPAIVPLAALYFGLLRGGKFLPQKLDPKSNIETRYNVFQAHVRFLLRLKHVLGGLYASNGLPYIAILNNNRKQTVGIENTQKRLVQRSFLFNILSAIHSQDLKF
jgi:hypothetical protein